MGQLKVVECYDLPENPDSETAYRLLPKDPDDAYYYERTDRNIGWITREEQDILRHSAVGIAGCGGMGGLVGAILVRLGVGEMRIADCEVFDVSNINRQFGAERGTVGKSKALVTAQKIRQISDDTALAVYPQGVTQETVESFVDGCDVICDEIEFWAVGARVLLHIYSRKDGISILCGDTVGFVTHIFLFTSSSMKVEEVLAMTYREAKEIESKIRLRSASAEETRRVMERMLRMSAPELPEYSRELLAGSHAGVRKRLFEERKAPIIATNPPLAAGFLADRALLYLLRDSGVRREIAEIPEMPGYMSFDAAGGVARTRQGKWW